jgi:DNA primase
MRMEGLTFPESIRRLADRVGVEIPEEKATPEEERRREERERLLRISEVTCEFYHQILLDEPEGAAGRRYLRQRGFEGDMVRMFRLGFAPDRWEALGEHLAGKGFDPKWARDYLGLIRPGKEGRGEFDLFRGRLLFPIQDSRGQVVAFGGRVLDESLPKYINSPESPIYHKGSILYGLFQAKEAMRRTGDGIVVEGYFDQLALYRAGFSNVVASCGTALTVEQARLLKRYCQRVMLLFDQDNAGRKATFRAMDVLLAEGLTTVVVELEAGEDPDSFLRRHSVEKLQQQISAARPVLQVFMEASLQSRATVSRARRGPPRKFLPSSSFCPVPSSRTFISRNWPKIPVWTSSSLKGDSVQARHSVVRKGTPCRGPCPGKTSASATRRKRRGSQGRGILVASHEGRCHLAPKSGGNDARTAVC